MGGAGAVLGAARIVAELAPKGVEAHFIIAACENMVTRSRRDLPEIWPRSPNVYLVHVARPSQVSSRGCLAGVGDCDAPGRHSHRLQRQNDRGALVVKCCSPGECCCDWSACRADRTRAPSTTIGAQHRCRGPADPRGCTGLCGGSWRHGRDRRHGEPRRNVSYERMHPSTMHAHMLGACVHRRRSPARVSSRSATTTAVCGARTMASLLT